MADRQQKGNHHPYGFVARAWSERFYLWRDEGTAAHFPVVLMTGGKLREQCAAPKIARLNATPLRGKNAPLKRDVLLAPSSCFALPGASGTLFQQGSLGATRPLKVVLRNTV